MLLGSVFKAESWCGIGGRMFKFWDGGRNFEIKSIIRKYSWLIYVTYTQMNVFLKSSIPRCGIILLINKVLNKFDTIISKEKFIFPISTQMEVVKYCQKIVFILKYCQNIVKVFWPQNLTPFPHWKHRDGRMLSDIFFKNKSPVECWWCWGGKGPQHSYTTLFIYRWVRNHLLHYFLCGRYREVFF